MFSRLIGLAVVLSLPGAALAQPSEFVIVPWGAGSPPTPGSGSIGMYSIEDGSYLGDLVPPDPARIVFPNTAIIGPDRLIYVSDSVNDTITRYDLRGQYVDTFLGPEDGLDNVRGLCFVGNELLIANNPTIGSNIDRTQVGVLRATLDGLFVDPLLPPGSVSAWDIHPTPDGELIIGDVDGFSSRPLVRYTTQGGFLGSPISVPFPTQITDAHTPGNQLVLRFSGRVNEFNAQGPVRTFNLAGLTNAGQGLFALRDGNLLVTNFNAGVYVHSAINGARLSASREGFGHYGMAKPARVCWPDLDNDQDTDFDDVARFLQSFAFEQDEADIALPFEQHDFADVLEFLQWFALGCP